MSYKFSPEEVRTCIKVLETLRSDTFENPDNNGIKTLVTLTRNPNGYTADKFY